MVQVTTCHPISAQQMSALLILSCCSDHFVWTPVSTQRGEQLISGLIISSSQSLSNSIIPMLWHNTVSSGRLTCAVMLIRLWDKSANDKPIFSKYYSYLSLLKNTNKENSSIERGLLTDSLLPWPGVLQYCSIHFWNHSSSKYRQWFSTQF